MKKIFLTFGTNEQIKNSDSGDGCGSLDFASSPLGANTPTDF